MAWLYDFNWLDSIQTKAFHYLRSCDIHRPIPIGMEEGDPRCWSRKWPGQLKKLVFIWNWLSPLRKCQMGLEAFGNVFVSFFLISVTLVPQHRPRAGLVLRSFEGLFDHTKTWKMPHWWSIEVILILLQHLEARWVILERNACSLYTLLTVHSVDKRKVFRLKK